MKSKILAITTVCLFASASFAMQFTGDQNGGTYPGIGGVNYFGYQGGTWSGTVSLGSSSFTNQSFYLGYDDFGNVLPLEGTMQSISVKVSDRLYLRNNAAITSTLFTVANTAAVDIVNTNSIGTMSWSGNEAETLNITNYGYIGHLHTAGMDSNAYLKTGSSVNQIFSSGDTNRFFFEAQHYVMTDWFIYANNNIFTLDINSSSSFASINVTGNVDDSAPMLLNFNISGSSADYNNGDKLLVFEHANLSDNFFENIAPGTEYYLDDKVFTVGMDLNSIYLTVSTIPEPSLYSTLTGISIIGLAVIRRKRK